MTVADLGRLVAEASVLAGGEHPCHILGHKWEFHGGRHCGCEEGSCSLPVHECPACGDCDYGENAEAHQIRKDCTDAGRAALGEGKTP